MMRVNGSDSMEAHMDPDRSDETDTGMAIQNEEDTLQRITAQTTTISTIAVQSGETRIVIALLQVRNVVPAT